MNLFRGKLEVVPVDEAGKRIIINEDLQKYLNQQATNLYGSGYTKGLIIGSSIILATTSLAITGYGIFKFIKNKNCKKGEK